MTKEELEAAYGEVYTTDEAVAAFEFHSFSMPVVSVTHKETGKRGILWFQDRPRFYHSFEER